MPTLIQLMPLETTLNALDRRGVLPSSLSSAEQRQNFGVAFHRNNFASARTTAVDLLNGYKDKVGKIINPQTVARTDGSLKTEGLDGPTARLQIKELQQQLGMAKGDGSIKDLTSDRRINLVIETNRDVMQNLGWFIQGNDPAALDAFPAQELIRVESREQERNWGARWLVGARKAGDTDAIRVYEQTGRMIARKDSPIWQELGNPDNFDDALGNPFPPFAWGSGMDVRDIAYSEAVDLGLIREGEAVRPQLPDDIGDLLKEAA